MKYVASAKIFIDTKKHGTQLSNPKILNWVEKILVLPSLETFLLYNLNEKNLYKIMISVTESNFNVLVFQINFKSVI